jgi:DNA-binding LacI/PurR family transcriptional regulator
VPAVTLQDVADRARVHRSTVALALRDHPRIPEATRRRLRALAEKLGYRQNPLVAALMQSRRSGRPLRHATLAFVTNYPTRYGWRPEHHQRPDFFPGAAARARDFGYKLEHFWLAEPGMTSARLSDILATRGIHGVILGRLPPGQRAIELSWERFSCVALGMTVRAPRLHRVTENHFETAFQAMQQCADRGYRRVGFAFTEANDSPSVGDRWLGAYLMQQLKFRAADRLPLCPGAPATRGQFTRWFERHRPDALLVNHAPPALAWLHGLGLSVPRDVGLVELEDHPEEGSAGVYYDPAKIGAVAVNLLMGLMHRNEKGVPSDQHAVLLSGEWREGGTLPRRSAASVG